MSDARMHLKDYKSTACPQKAKARRVLFRWIGKPLSRVLTFPAGDCYELEVGRDMGVYTKDTHLCLCEKDADSMRRIKSATSDLKNVHYLAGDVWDWPLDRMYADRKFDALLFDGPSVSAKMCAWLANERYCPAADGAVAMFTFNVPMRSPFQIAFRRHFMEWLDEYPRVRDAITTIPSIYSNGVEVRDFPVSEKAKYSFHSQIMMLRCCMSGWRLNYVWHYREPTDKRGGYDSCYVVFTKDEKIAAKPIRKMIVDAALDDYSEIHPVIAATCRNKVSKCLTRY